MALHKCTVPELSYCTVGSVHGWCLCSECVAGADRVGYWRPFKVLKETRAPQTSRYAAILNILVTTKRNMLLKNARWILIKMHSEVNGLLLM